MKKRIAIIGGGPAGLFLYKQLIQKNFTGVSVTIFEASGKLGAGMPYSSKGANAEHITNVSGNEIPELELPVTDWLKTLPDNLLSQFNLDKDSLSDYKVLPRLLFGEYLSRQFGLLTNKAEAIGITTDIKYHTVVTDIVHQPKQKNVLVKVGEQQYEFDVAIMCTGHNWQVDKEATVPGFFDSPYPPAKLARRFDHTVGILGSSLTAIDALRTLARNNGRFVEHAPNQLSFIADEESKDFKIQMYSINGLLPGIRFHLDDPHLSNDSLLTEEEIACHIKDNDGFLSLDFIFEKDFKEPIREKDPAFYEKIKNMNLETFVEHMMSQRERADAFVLFKKEYEEARQSIQQKRSVYWKEMLAVLSFAMNYPAKHFSAEDMTRLKKVLMPLISVIIAFVPQSSCEELIALHDAGKLELIPVDENSGVEAETGKSIVYHYNDEEGKQQQIVYKTFINCIGQKPLLLKDFPFVSLVNDKVVAEAKLQYRSAEVAEKEMDNNDKIEKAADGKYYLKVPGIAINDCFQPLDADGNANQQLYIMAVPYIGGFNPDYSGLDFCEEASGLITKQLTKDWNMEPVQ